MATYDDDLKKAQSIMLQILVDIHKLCEKHDLCYWLDAGTLLGAVRHKGFIPWDDDADVAMPIEDYKKFICVCLEELPDEYILQYKDDDSDFTKSYAKIRRKGTALVETQETGDESYHHGIFVDIFPYCGYSSRQIKLLKIRKKMRTFKDKVRDNKVKSFFVRPALIIPLAVLSLFKKMAKFSESFDEMCKSDYVTYNVEMDWFYKIRASDVLPVRLTEKAFEGKDFYLPKSPDAYLREMYGEYMVPPPESERIPHNRLLLVDKSIGLEK